MQNFHSLKYGLQIKTVDHLKYKICECNSNNWNRLI